MTDRQVVARAQPASSRAAARPEAVRVLGYASVDGGVGDRASGGLRRQAERIAQECTRRGLLLVDVVSEREPGRGRALERPGLAYALDRIGTGMAQALVVTQLSQLSHSVADLGRLLEWLSRSQVRLLATAERLDTGERAGEQAASILISVARWENERISDRTRKGLAAARRKGLPGVADDPALRERVVRMRADGLTLQAIADRLNAEGVPTVRGGAKWRPSSVQAAVGYRRRPAGMPAPQDRRARAAAGKRG